MDFTPLTLADLGRFRAAEKSAPAPNSTEVNFTNLFIWRSFYRPRWAEHQGCLSLIACPEGVEPFGLPPVGGGDRLAALDFTLDALRDLTPAPTCRRVPENLLELMSAAGRPYTAVPDRDNDEYVYLSGQLAALNGRRMHQKKNHYNHFVSRNRFECLPLTEDLRPELMAVQESWLATKVERDEISPTQLGYEAEAVREMLEHLRELDQLGLAIRINGRLEAFTLGEVIRPDMVLVHLEKANPKIRGLFVALASHFCRALPPGLTYVNREQDLGLPGLRQSKESFKPDHMVRKFILRPAGAA